MQVGDRVIINLGFPFSPGDVANDENGNIRFYEYGPKIDYDGRVGTIARDLGAEIFEVQVDGFACPIRAMENELIKESNVS